jgi:hypothetical protein
MTGWEWNESYDRMLLEWRKFCSIHMWLQDKSYYFFKRVDSWLTYPAILISAATSIGIFSISSCANDEAKIKQYITGTLAMSVAILASLSKHLDSSSKMHQFSQTCKEYQSIIRKINFILNQNYEDRNEVMEVMTELRGEVDRVTQQQLLPPERIIRLYQKTHRTIESSIYTDLEDQRLVTKQSLHDKPFVRELFMDRLAKQPQILMPSAQKGQMRQQQQQQQPQEPNVNLTDGAECKSQDELQKI